MSARIISRKEFPIPYTDRMQLVFDIRYSVDLELKPADIPFEIQAEDDVSISFCASLSEG
jgi:hypothetical protein